MKQIVVLIILLFTASFLFGQSRCSKVFKRLQDLSKKNTVTPADFSSALLLVKALEANFCTDYIINKNGVDSVIAGRASLFGEICVKNNSTIAVEEYINYIKRHHGSAEKQISFSFEKLFTQRPGDVLSFIGYDEDLLNKLEWGFVNNHTHLNRKNYRTVFYRVNPQIRHIYPKYKKAIDYLLSEIGGELKDGEPNKKVH
jgi:hypothetical protein